jgi:CheY-like chemotaxis protein
MPLARVLLVDDEPSLGVIVASLGRRAGYTADCLQDTASAWNSLQQTMPDLLILDVQLVGESGLALCRRVRATPRLAHLPIALFTHWGLSEAIAAGLEAGADYLLAKDLLGQPERWLRRLAELLPSADGEQPPSLIGWAAEAPTSPSSPPNDRWVALVEKALRHPVLRDAGPELSRIFLGRALQAGFPGLWKGLIASDGRGVLTEGLPSHPRPDALGQLVGSLADQVWRLLGAEQASPFWMALAEVVPGRPQFAPRHRPPPDAVTPPTP